MGGGQWDHPQWWKKVPGYNTEDLSVAHSGRVSRFMHVTVFCRICLFPWFFLWTLGLFRKCGIFLYFTTEYVYCSRYNRLNDPLAFLPNIFPVAYRSRCPGYFIPLFCIGLYIVEVVPILNMHDEVVIAGG